jgi:Xaa-Pro aminopeptidase
MRKSARTYNGSMDIQPFLDRRARLLARMGDGVAILPTAPERLRNRDATYPYRSDSYFHYLTGFDEPEAVLVLIAGDAPRSILFCRDRDPEKEIWDGYRYGPEGAQQKFGFDEAHAIAALDEKLPGLIANQPSLWHSLGFEPEWDARIGRALNAVRAQSRAGKRAPGVVQDLRAVLDEMRLVKDGFEIALMRRAADIAAAAHRRAMQAAAPGRHEFEIEAEFLHEFRRRGSQFPAYTTIVASGPGACVLHYVNNDRQMQDGELLLIDAGCELDGYASDITRTFPVNGRFSGPQEDVYELVEAAQAAAIATIKPGAHFMAPHEAAVKVLAQGMIDLKLLHGSVDAVIESESYKRFYMHRTSHWLGMDVHDVGEYKTGDDWRQLAPGMVLTVEPGCYVRPADDVPAAFHNIGIRIEDDALVTLNGCEVLTTAAPKSIADIEALMVEAKS